MWACFHRLDFIDHIHALDDFAEYGIATVAWVVESGIIYYVDEKLGSGAVWIARASHGDGATVIFETIGAFVGDAFAGFLFGQICSFLGESTTLNHKAVDHTVKDGAIVVLLVYVGDEVFDRDWCLLGVQLDHDVTFGSFEPDLLVFFYGHGSFGFTRTLILGGLRASDQWKEHQCGNGEAAFHRGGF